MRSQQQDQQTNSKPKSRERNKLKNISTFKWNWHPATCELRCQPLHDGGCYPPRTNLVFLSPVLYQFQFGPLHPNYQTTPWHGRLLLGKREKLCDHGVNNIFTLVSVTIETCEWNPRFSRVNGSRHHTKNCKIGGDTVLNLSKTHSHTYLHKHMLRF